VNRTHPAVLVTGFGPFLDVGSNPSGRMARLMDGRRVLGHTVIGRSLPVSYARGLPLMVAQARAISPRLVVGMGVHRGPGVLIECVGRNRAGPTPDVDGMCPDSLGAGPAELPVDLNAERLARALGGVLSMDAGQYLCNAWLYTALRDVQAPSIFIHIPPDFDDSTSLLDGLAVLVEQVIS
jgi:pyroglutamyl-peptidase